MWPIIGAISDNKNLPLFLIGSYIGPSAPESSCEFLKDFVAEIRTLKLSGILVGTSRTKVPFKIRLFSCDAPARSFITEVMGHGSNHGCSKCSQIGSKANRKAVVYDTRVRNLRTDSSFAKRTDPSHHHDPYKTKKTALETANIGMVSQVPIDAMHLIDLGVMKKMLKLILKSKVYGCSAKVDDISNYLLSLRTHIPCEFQRSPRALKNIHFWKATEFRQFALYTGVVALKNNVDDDVFYHFLLLHCAYRILSCERLVKTALVTAQNMLEKFVLDFTVIYGEDKISYNVHTLLHLSECVKQFGVVDSFSAYKNENFMLYLKKKISKPSKILQQLHNRIFEEDIYNPQSTKDKNKFNEFSLNYKNECDSYCLIGETQVKIIGFAKAGDEQCVVGLRCQNVADYFKEPIKSSELGIFCYDQVSETPEIFKSSLVKQKYFNIPCNGKYVLLPIIHSSFHSFTSE